MAGNTLRLGVELNDGGVAKKLNGISQAFDKIGGKGSGASLFGNVGAKAISKGFDIVSGSIGGVIDILGDAVTAASEDQASNALLQQSLHNNVTAWNGNMEAVDKYIDKQIDRGFSDDATRESLGKLVGVTHDVTKAMDLNTLAADLARAKNIPLSEATDIVTKAALGNSKALKPLGIDIGKTSDAAAILDGIQKNVAGSADTYNDTLAGKLNISQLKYNEAMEKIGYELMPVVATLMQKFADDWLPALGRGWDKVWAAIHAVVGVISDVIGALDRGIKKVQEFARKIDSLIPKVNGISAMPPIPGLPIPHFAQGGTVPGPLNSPQLIVAHGGETVTPTSRSGGGGGHSHAIYMDGRLVAEAVDDRMAQMLRRAASTSQRV